MAAFHPAAERAAPDAPRERMLCARRLITTSLLSVRPSALCASMADASRDRMMNEIADGGASCTDGDASQKAVLVRGCDPQMAERAGKMLPPMLGNAQTLGVTDDDTFFDLLQQRTFDVIFFAPGACRFSAARQPIPGGNQVSAGWGLAEYKAKVREHQPHAAIVETTEERRAALTPSLSLSSLGLSLSLSLSLSFSLSLA